MSINLENPKEVTKFIANLGDGKKEMANEDGSLVIALKNEFDGLELRTHQNNGWVRVNYYGSDGSYEGESYDGRWR